MNEWDQHNHREHIRCLRNRCPCPFSKIVYSLNKQTVNIVFDGMNSRKTLITMTPIMLLLFLMMMIIFIKFYEQSLHFVFTKRSSHGRHV